MGDVVHRHRAAGKPIGAIGPTPEAWWRSTRAIGFDFRRRGVRTSGC